MGTAGCAACQPGLLSAFRFRDDKAFDFFKEDETKETAVQMVVRELDSFEQELKASGGCVIGQRTEFADKTPSEKPQLQGGPFEQKERGAYIALDRQILEGKEKDRIAQRRQATKLKEGVRLQRVQIHYAGNAIDCLFPGVENFPVESGEPKVVSIYPVKRERVRVHRSDVRQYTTGKIIQRQGLKMRILDIQRPRSSSAGGELTVELMDRDLMESKHTGRHHGEHQPYSAELLAMLAAKDFLEKECEKRMEKEDCRFRLQDECDARHKAGWVACRVCETPRKIKIDEPGVMCFVCREARAKDLHAPVDPIGARCKVCRKRHFPEDLILEKVGATCEPCMSLCIQDQQRKHEREQKQREQRETKKAKEQELREFTEPEEQARELKAKAKSKSRGWALQQGPRGWPTLRRF
jgi:hypothetical protein